MTQIVRWAPFASMTNLQDRINRIFDDVVRSKDVEDDINLYTWKPVVDIYDDEDSLVITAELPGVNKEEVSVEIKDNIVSIKGERVKDKEINKENYYRKESSYGSFYRAFALPSAVNSDKIKATFKDGMLKVEIPKPEEDKPKQVLVKVD
ncbi:MAG: Hsp20/alpha crystallin family protein [Proteobacteria bacterium]|nr:Hsp20/alpha crystallin family protein [Pseudomonadota bacterium]